MSLKDIAQDFFQSAQNNAVNQAKMHYESNKNVYGQSIRSSIKKTIQMILTVVVSISFWFLGLLGLMFANLVKADSLTISTGTLNTVSLGLLMVPMVSLAIFFYKKL